MPPATCEGVPLPKAVVSGRVLCCAWWQMDGVRDVAVLGTRAGGVLLLRLPSMVVCFSMKMKFPVTRLQVRHAYVCGSQQRTRLVFVLTDVM